MEIRLAKLDYAPSKAPRASAGARFGLFADRLERWSYSNRCVDCGKRLKMKPGEALGPFGTGQRMSVCRACGLEQPETVSLLGVAGAAFAREEELLEAPMGWCEVCAGDGDAQFQLQYSKDGRYLFCRNCGHAAKPEEIADLAFPIGPPEEIVGWSPLRPENTKTGAAIVEHLSSLGFDVDQTLMALVDEDSNCDGVYSKLVVVTSDAIRIFVLDDEGNWDVSQFPIAELSNMQTTGSNHLNLTRGTGDGENFGLTSTRVEDLKILLKELTTIHRFNMTPHPDRSSDTRNTTSGSGPSRLEELSKLADLLDRGLIDRQEFDSEKSRMFRQE